MGGHLVISVVSLSEGGAGRGLSGRTDPPAEDASWAVPDTNSESRAQGFGRRTLVVSDYPVKRWFGAYRDRTGDLRLAKPALSQLS